KAVIAETEKARNADLAKEGIRFETPSLKPEAVSLSATALPAERLQRLKTEKLNQLIKSNRRAKPLRDRFGRINARNLFPRSAFAGRGKGI
ncbi:MAG TPA: hypothetical protein VJS66_08815, partial [Burkholderiales bacterium]|nr:hypothetical protein [Burkholderiales bacterium]